ncbi:MAG: pyridoxal-phosphate dependent enzyme [Promethearchaeota archaeon]
MTRTRPLLFERFPDLESGLPWKPLVPEYTPVEEMEALGRELGAAAWVKRDDLSSPVYGGNKVRKFEFLLADALEKDRRQVITFGGIGSNHCVANAAFCRELGLKAVAGLVDQPVTPVVRKNLLLDAYFGSEVFYSRGFFGVALKGVWQYLKRKGAYLVMPGGSTPLGSVGFVDAAFELKAQVDAGLAPEPDVIFVACGSTGTAAGLGLGVKLAGLKSKVQAVQVSFPSFTNLKALHKLARKTLRLLRERGADAPGVPTPAALDLSHLTLDPSQYGGEYGRPTRESVDAVLAARRDGLLLETTYTGKALASLVAAARGGELAGKVALYWHTYNSVDYSEAAAGVDYHALPESLWWVFEEPLPTFDGIDPERLAGCFEP